MSMRTIITQSGSRRLNVAVLLAIVIPAVIAAILGFWFAKVTSLGSDKELTFAWYEGRTLDEVAETFRRKNFQIYRKQVEGEYGEQIHQVIARHDNYRPGLLVRTGLLVKVSSQDRSERVDKVEFFYFYIGL